MDKMGKSKERFDALLQQALAAVVVSDSKRKTLKGQRKAAAKPAKVSRKVTKATAPSTIEIFGWTPPVTFIQWMKWVKGTQLGEMFTSLQLSLFRIAETGSAKGMIDMFDEATRELFFKYSLLQEEHIAYRNARFNEPITFSHVEGNAFDKIVKREAWLETQGKKDLGLIGLSAIDRVQLAVKNAWVRMIESWLAGTGADEVYVKEMGQALRDLRSDDELRAIAALAGRSRYVVANETDSMSFPRMRKQSQTEEVKLAARRLELRAEFDTLPVKAYASEWVPSVGSVYREIQAVTREGLRQFQNILEGLTPDGIISDAVQYTAGHRWDLAEAGLDRAVARLDASLVRESAEDTYFNKWDFNDSFIVRRAVATTALTLPSHTVAEAKAKVAMEMLVEGMRLHELREAFSDLSERAFGQLFRDAQVIATEVKATELFMVTFDQMVEEYTQA